jgi:hypothetical protein
VSKSRPFFLLLRFHGLSRSTYSLARHSPPIVDPTPIEAPRQREEFPPTRCQNSERYQDITAAPRLSIANVDHANAKGANAVAWVAAEVLRSGG